MCQSQAEGGRRCAAHTRPAYAKAMFKVTFTGNSEKRAKAFEAGRQAIIDHASTPQGLREFMEDKAEWERRFVAFWPKAKRTQAEVLGMLDSIEREVRARREAARWDELNQSFT